MKLQTLTLTVLLALPLTAQPRVGKSNISVPVPPDPHELVTGRVEVPAAGERGADLEIIQHALQNSRFMNSSMSPFRMDVSFTSAAEGAESGPGQFSQTWLSGRAWRWTASLGNVSVVRGAGPQGPYAESSNPAPMPVHLVRNAIFSSMYDIAMGTQLRTATIKWNGKAAKCMMTSGVVGPANYDGRLWEELEYCFDDAGRMVVSSFAPGVFTTYGYAKNQTLHGHTFPDTFAIYVGGKQVIDATLQITDATGTDPNSLAPTAEMVGRSLVMQAPFRQPMSLPAPAGVSKVMPLLIHANIVNGEVRETEVCAAANESLIPAALEAVKSVRFGGGGQQQAYFDVKFIPASN